MHNQGFWPRLEPFFYKRQNVLLKTCWCFVLYTSIINEELCFWKIFPKNYQHFQNIFLYLQCQIIVVINTAECPDRCSIRNWAIFMSIGQPYRGDSRIGTIYEIVEVTQMRNNLRLSFPNFIARKGCIVSVLANREMAAVLASCWVQENLPKMPKY